MSNEEGMVVYSSKFNRYGISFTMTTANNIDSQITGYVCSMPQELQQVGLPVTISGVLKRFNQEENIKPEIGGQDLYYLATNQIIKRQ
ncbi:hypothetical protein OCK74_04185 [Chitinophagaceae bacterium LB-8]|uniref:Uncharacterized protein n=1 Tax=Paraflavisolibacter caeni TaxID=2982496 RepID=A0A9X2XTX7_9BACT|nr:hypothetical protein [Paraflavisolibacter caeni]MCU7548297.1 hypothetical protein [Paraflavisolibacter caeni]